MPTSSCVDEHEQVIHEPTLPWCTVVVDWPVEVVVVEVEVVAPRELNVLEWALERALDEFGDEVPTLAELAEELEIAAPAMLEDTLEVLIVLGAVEVTNAGQPLDLPGCRLTASGSELLAEGRVGGLPERHGLRLHFDAITGEHLRTVSKNSRTEPANPVMPPDQLPERLTEIGLERVRQLSIAQEEPFQKGESRIQATTVRFEDGGHIWLPVQVELGIDHNGVLRAHVHGGSDAQRVWLEERDLNLKPFANLDRASTGAWADGRHVPRPPVPAEQWLGKVDRLVEPSSALDEVHRLVNSARREIIAHAGWLDAPELEKDLAEAARRGVRCYVCGAEASLTYWLPGTDRAPGFLVTGGSIEAKRPMALVVDGTCALRIDTVKLRTPAGKEITIEAAAFVKASQVQSLRQRLLSGLIESLPGDDETHCFAAFAVSRDPKLWEQGARLLWERTTGVERIHVLHRWASWGLEIASGAGPSEEWFSWARRAWSAAADATSEGLDGRLAPLLDAAVDLLAPEEALAHFAERVPATSALEDAGPVCELVWLSLEVRRQWPEFDPADDCPGFVKALRTCLEVSDPPRCCQAVEEAARALSADDRLGSAGVGWAQLLSAYIPKPHDLASLATWLEAHTPLKPLLPPSFTRAATKHLKGFDAELRAAHGRRDAVVNRLQEAWGELGLPDTDLRKHLSITKPSSTSKKMSAGRTGRSEATSRKRR